MKNKSKTIDGILHEKPSFLKDPFGAGITGALNDVAGKEIAKKGERESVDKKKSSIVKNVLSKFKKK